MAVNGRLITVFLPFCCGVELLKIWGWRGQSVKNGARSIRGAPLGKDDRKPMMKAGRRRRRRQNAASEAGPSSSSGRALFGAAVSGRKHITLAPAPGADFMATHPP